MKILYRSEIDGLRGISVLGVLFFHLKFDTFSGGYLGVDVFIVISGYLIASIVYNDLKLKQFSFLKFFQRRARRLIPSYLIVLFISVLFSYFVFLPEELIKFSKSLISSTFFLSNFFFWLNSGYWDETNLSPLLHTWSLSLEWQFYLFLPIFSYVVWKIFKKESYLINSFVLLFFCSFALSLLFIDRNISFFLLPFRIYEFLIGALVYFTQEKNIKIIRKNNNFFSFCAIGLIIGSFIFFDSLSQVPGYICLIPCLSTALLIYIKDSLVHKILKTKYLVFLGLISYSLYLFHWPIIIFYNSISIFEITIYEKFLLIFVSIIISILNFYLIEKPFRKKFFNLQFLVSTLIFLSLIIFSISVVIKEGYPQRVKGSSKPLVERLVDKELDKRRKFLNQHIDLKFNLSQNKKILILGDSLGKDMLIALRENLSEKRFDIEYLLFSHWCFEQNRFIQFFNFFDRINRRNLICVNERKNFNQNSHLLKQANFIILSSSWHNNSLSYLNKIIDYVESYSDAKIIVSSKTVVFPDIRKLVLKINEKDLENLNEIAYGAKHKSVFKFNKKLHNKVKSLNLKFLDKSKLICSETHEICNVYDKKNNELYLFDHFHWTFNGAKFFGNKIDFEYFFN